MECEKLPKCPFFNNQLADMPAVIGLLKQTYCLGDKTDCARYLVAGAGIQVPPDLFPNDLARAQRLMQAGKR